MPTLASQIDALYQGNPAEFIAARNALAKTLSGDEARRVRALTKPTVVPWAVNQVYWHARDVYQRLLKAGEKLRQAQLAALKGKAADIRDATMAHRQAIGEAVKAATSLASPHGLKPDPEPLARMFEALSIHPDVPESAGRFTKVLQPQGFEALAGVTIKPGAMAKHQPAARGKAGGAARSISDAERRKRERDEAEALRKRDLAIKKAEAAYDRAKAAEERARQAWTQAKKELAAAERELMEAQSHE